MYYHMLVQIKEVYEYKSFSRSVDDQYYVVQSYEIYL